MRRARNVVLVIGLLAALAVVGCALTRGPEQRASIDPSDKASYPVITHIKTRHEMITVMSGPKGPLYTVKDKDGKVLLWESTPEQFEAALPKAYENISRGIAEPGDWAGR